VGNTNQKEYLGILKKKKNDEFEKGKSLDFPFGINSFFNVKLLLSQWLFKAK
jgi:hypothetical protein